MGDRISSVRLLGASEVTVFRDSDMRGRSTRFISDVSDLRRDGWNDQISSIAVTTSDNRYGNNGRGRGRNRGYDNSGNYDGYSDNGSYNGWSPDRAPVWGRAAVTRGRVLLRRRQLPRSVLLRAARRQLHVAAGRVQRSDFVRSCLRIVGADLSGPQLPRPLDRDPARRRRSSRRLARHRVVDPRVLVSSEGLRPSARLR